MFRALHQRPQSGNSGVFCFLPEYTGNFAERAKKRQNCNGKRKKPLLVAGLQQQGWRGDRILNKTAERIIMRSKVLARIVLIPATFKVTGVPQMGTSVKPVSLAASRQEIFLDSVSALCRALAPPMGGLGGLGSSDGHSVVKVRLYDSGGLLREALNMFAAGE